jgi:murein DD-endopeptidase MepM/ murein hydrolase activator NlpD
MWLPFPEGTEVPVGQGSHGHFSHKGTSTYAIDFTVPEGTLVVAAREGRVLATRSDSDVECDDVSCLHDANYVVVDHGDGTTARYWHLQQEGVLVEPGDPLCAGDLIGLSGNTGFSTVPHLHLVVKDLFGHSVPLLFHDVMETTGGAVFAGGTFESENSAPVDCATSIEYSECPEEAFVERGLLLDSGIPCRAVVPGRAYPVSGRALTAAPKVQFTFHDPDTGTWNPSCFDVESDGSFSGIIAWPETMTASRSALMYNLATADCRAYQGWDSSPSVFFIEESLDPLPEHTPLIQRNCN